MQETSFSTKYFSSLAEGTIRTTVDHVAQTFRSSNQPDPRNDNRGCLSYVLQQQYKGYKNQDKNVKKQKALPLIVLRELHKNKTTVKNIAIAQLCIGTIFFAMLSCEYLRTNIPEERKLTNTLLLHNIRFYVKGRQAPHYHPRLALSETVTTTFEFQKSDEQHESVTMHCSGCTLLCPVRPWSSIVRRVISYPGTTIDTWVNTILFKNSLKKISSTTARTNIRSAAGIVREDVLGFALADIGTHYIRSGAAMHMYLAQVPTFSITMIGRWSSDAFL